ncbi:MAG TPA: hypothetical protein VM534_09800, partial [Thermoanaerobaculia bacterium]|nr:hypothetical protein [Thermoanaerobaculia bacterium]
WLIGLPVAIALGFGLDQGILGLWWGLCAGLTVVAVMLFFRFQRLSSRPIRPLMETAETGAAEPWQMTNDAHLTNNQPR